MAERRAKSTGKVAKPAARRGDGRWVHVHSDPRGNAKLRKEFDQALQHAIDAAEDIRKID